MKNKIKTDVLRNKFSFLYFPLLGIGAILWFLVRVIPKPSRASYPCQQIAVGVGGGFAAYLLGTLGLLPILHKIKYKIVKHRASVILVSAITLTLAGALLASKYMSNPGFPAFVPVDSANQPIGESKGLFPGRVAWVQDRQITNWDGATGFWWGNGFTSQTDVDNLLTRTLLLYTGENDIAAAWEVLFLHFNQVQGRGSVGYQPGEKIVIKINSNQDNKATWDNGGFHSPHLIYALVSQLVNVVGAAGADITIADPSRYIGDPIYDKIRGNPDPHFQDVRFVVKPVFVKNGRIAAVPDTSSPIHFVPPYPEDPNIKVHYPPVSYTEATYLINFALLRSHVSFGVTLCGKNQFGAVFNDVEFRPNLLHGSAITFNPPNQMGDPHCHPVLMGHGEIGGKTLLYLIDGLYTAIHQGSKEIVKWQSLGDDWASSLLVSQDPVAVDSVAFDFLRSEPNMQIAALTENVCNYLHESALADNPPSGAFYDPEDDGTRLQSLGTHEHWNNAGERLYSRDLGAGSGIELVRDCAALNLLSPNGGEVLQQNTAYAIRWQAHKLKKEVKISLWKDDVNLGVIVPEVNNDLGAYTWTVGNLASGTAAPGSGYRIKLKERYYNYVDFSDSAFSIADIKVLSPNGGEFLEKDSPQQITWQAAGFTNPVKITLWKNGGLVGIIAKSVDAASGTYSWTAGDYIGGSALPGADYKIRIRARNLVVNDFSDSAFSIAEIKVLSPNGGESLTKGSTQQITWQAAGFSDPVKITLWKNGSLVGIIAKSVDAGSGAYSWTVGDYIGGSALPGADYKIRIRARDLVINDFSDSAFSIASQ